MSLSFQRVLARATIASFVLLLGRAAYAGVQITHYDSYTQEATITGEGAGMWCADPNDAAVAVGWAMFSYSKDEGDTWSAPVRVTAEPITRHNLAEHEKWLATRRIKPVPGKEILPEHTLGSFPTCCWDLIAAADGDFLIFPLSTPDDR
jgi:hypothetical protein